MANLIGKTVDMTLAGSNGNAYVLMGVFESNAKAQDWTQEEIDTVLTECKKGDYDHLVETLLDHCESSNEE